jgi:hypothetical protein
VIFTNETQAEFIIKTLIKPVVEGNFETLNVKQAAENYNTMHVQEQLKTMVWSGGCANWNLNAAGRNTTNYHDPTWKFWWDLYWPVWRDFDLSGRNITLPLAPWTKWSLWAVAVPFLSVSLVQGGRTLLSRY